ncbi:hypothetical protein B7463_g7392, partial [Scytalidium lignicola]
MLQDRIYVSRHDPAGTDIKALIIAPLFADQRLRRTASSSSKRYSVRRLLLLPTKGIVDDTIWVAPCTVAEAIGLVASIIAVVETSGRLIKLCKDYIESVHNAPRFLAHIQEKASSLRDVLEDMQRLCESHPISSKNLKRLMDPHGALTECQDVVKHLEQLINIGSNGTASRKRFKIQAAMAKFSWPLKEGKAQKLLEDLQRYQTTTSLALDLESAYNTGTILNGLGQLQKFKDDQERGNRQKAIVEWLVSRVYGNDQRRYMDQRLPETGLWLLDSEEFRAWRYSEKSTLFCHGIPGAGKTTITAIVIDSLYKSFQHRSSVGIAFVYFNDQQQVEQRAENFLSNLLGQFIQSLPDSPDMWESVEHLYQLHHSKHSPPTLNEVLDALHDVAARYSKVFIILDALDEYPIPNDCSRFLSKILALQLERRVGIFATSRLSRDAKQFEEGDRLCLSKNIRASKEDIQKYLDHKIPEMKCIQQNMKLQDEIRAQIGEKADGVFLLAKLHMESLADKRTIREINYELENIQNGADISKALDDAYQHIWNRIERWGRSSKRLAEMALAWVTCAVRPLTELELRHALAINSDMRQFDEDNITSTDEILSVCAGLLTIDSTSSLVQLAHSTAKEYLGRKWSNWFRRAQKSIAETCITYLCFDEFSQGPFADIQWFGPGEMEHVAQKKPLLKYVSSYWGHHLSRARKDATEIKDLEALPLIDLLLLKLSQMPNNMLFSFQVNYTAYATIFRVIFENNLLEHDARDDSGQTALHWAAAREDEDTLEMVQKLVQRGFDINATDDECRTPLHYACHSGHVGVVKFPLDSGADREIGNGSVTPLVEASYNCHAKIVGVLLDKGADVNVTSSLGTPLRVAELYFMKPLITATRKLNQLLKAGFDVNKTAGEFHTSLQAAAAGSNNFSSHNEAMKVVELLLENGADVNARGGHFETALQAATINNHEEMVAKLIACGANISIPLKGNDPGSRDQIPRIVRAALKQTVIAIMMNNDKGFEKFTGLSQSAFIEAVRRRDIQSIKTSGEISVLAFEEMVAFARNEERGRVRQETPKMTPGSLSSILYRRFLKSIAVPTTQVTTFVTSLLHRPGAMNREIERSLARVSASSSISNTAGSKLEILTSSAVSILSKAIEVGDREIIQLLASYWVSGLRHIIFPGKSSDRMLEMLVNSRVLEFEDFFRYKDIAKADIWAKVGVELLSAAIEGRKEDERLEQLSESFSRMWSLALRSIIERNYIEYGKLEEFLRSLKNYMLKGVESGNIEDVKRSGVACIEILVAMVADENPHITDIMAKLVTKGWRYTIEHGGGDDIHIGILKQDFWNYVKGRNSIRAENLGDGLLKVFHVSVRDGHKDIERILSINAIKVVERAFQDYEEAIISQIVHQQIGKFIHIVSQVDQSPIHYFKCIFSLILTAQHLGSTNAQRILGHEFVLIMTDQTQERDALMKQIRNLASRSTNGEDITSPQKVVMLFHTVLGNFPGWREATLSLMKVESISFDPQISDTYIDEKF